jgi:hypothetical protein
MDNKPEKLWDLFGRDLAGWQIVECYFLKLKQRCGAGIFPAITKDGSVVLVLEKGYLKQVWGKIERRHAVVDSIKTIMNLTEGVASQLGNIDGDNTGFLHVFSSEEIGLLCNQEGSFDWTPGLLNITPVEFVDDPDFN